MTEKRLLAVLGFLLALIGGVLAIVAALSNFPRQLDLENVARRIVDLIVGIAAIFGGLFIYKGRMSTGGLLTIVIGVVMAILSGIGLASVLVIVGGILGIIGAEVRA